jgi:hypothetical protein
MLSSRRCGAALAIELCRKLSLQWSTLWPAACQRLSEDLHVSHEPEFRGIAAPQHTHGEAGCQADSRISFSHAFARKGEEENHRRYHRADHHDFLLCLKGKIAAAAV